jgi:hypothetical protein
MNVPVDIIANIILVANNTGDGKSMGYLFSPPSLSNNDNCCFFRAASTTARVVGSIFSVANINSVGDKSIKLFIFDGVVVSNDCVVDESDVVVAVDDDDDDDCVSF